MSILGLTSPCPMSTSEVHPTKSKATQVTIEDVKGMLARGDHPVFLDARNPHAWASSDVTWPGALRVPADEVAQHVPDIPRDRPAIAYCT